MSQVKTGNQVFTSPGDIAEAFNNHFTSTGQSPALEIPSLEIDPLSFVQKAIRLLKAIDVGRASGLDKIPNRLLKIATDVVAPPLTGTF